MTSKSVPKGGNWLTQNVGQDEVFVPEDLTAEHRAIKDAVAEFMRLEVAPESDALEAHDNALLKRLLRKAGEAGVLSVEIPEAFGGLGLDLVYAALAFEAVGGGGNGSFATAVGAHTGIGTWPILFFGNDEQRAKYLPKLAGGEGVAAYCLTESGSGSDAMAAKCKATLSPDGNHWIVNGGKVFITNAAIADVFTVFVKIDGDDKKKACLIVERDTPGFTIGKEENKMGIRGSSTCSLTFEDALVPRENLLGEIGRGHKIVLNTLNLGRFKLGAAAAGGLKAAVNMAVRYGAERKQFGQPLVAFDAIQAKLADMVIDAWVGESMVYRTAGLLSDSLAGAAPGEASVKAIEEYTIECSLVKVALSEMLDDAVDQTLQIFGGYGFIEEYPAARAYRDSRINRIFEGTNEINRMLAVGDLLRRGMKGSIDLMEAMTSGGQAGGTADLKARLAGAKQAVLYVLGQAVAKHMAGIEKEQQLLIELADMLIDIYGMESAFLRHLKAGGGDGTLESCIVRAYFSRAMQRIEVASERVLCAVLDTVEERQEAICKVSWLAPRSPENIVALRREIAAAALAGNGYPLG
jgi:alkylation response protein AidB-like acyl-CoA dehydrogenase